MFQIFVGFEMFDGFEGSEGLRVFQFGLNAQWN